MANTIKEDVHKLYWEGNINCARTTLLILGKIFNTEIQHQTYVAAVGLHGAGGYRGQCGLVEGTLMFLGIYLCELGKSESETVQYCYQFADSFTEKFKSIRCYDLRPDGFSQDDKPHMCECLTVETIEFSKEFIEQIE